MDFIEMNGKIYSLTGNFANTLSSDSLLDALRSAEEVRIRPCAIKDCKTCECMYESVDGGCDCIADPTVPYDTRFCYMYKRW